MLKNSTGLIQDAKRTPPGPFVARPEVEGGASHEPVVTPVQIFVVFLLKPGLVVAEVSRAQSALWEVPTSSHD